MALVVLLVAAPAALAAQDEPAETISGTVFNRLVNDAGDREQIGVAGVRVEALDSSGAVAGEAITAEDGSYSIGLPGPGSYTIRIDVDSLPEGIAPEGDSPTERVVDVLPNQSKVGSFFLGQDTREVKGRLTGCGKAHPETCG